MMQARRLVIWSAGISLYALAACGGDGGSATVNNATVNPPVGVAGKSAAAGGGAISTPPMVTSIAGTSGATPPITPPPGMTPAPPARPMGTAGRAAMPGAAGGAPIVRGGSAAPTPVQPGAAGMGALPAAGAAAPAAGAPAPGTDMFAAERQICVDHINMYRATLMLPPLKRGTPEQEACSDMGAKKDGDAMAAHSSAGNCKGLGGQNTCPGWPVRGGKTLGQTLQGCLDQMWDEGEPPNGTDACIMDRTGCFPKYGHWINMSMKNYGTVACGFYKMSNGSYWMNQNFGR